ncbi:hypothetical protein EAE96_003375 [Botrytis aclada]|nr:hypothetical protein EAE96_003375 [Botrytis aclada]
MGMSGNHQMGHDGTMQEHMPSMTTIFTHPAILGTPIVQPHTSSESLTDLDVQIQYLQQQKREHQLQQSQEQQRNFYAQSRMIPPTPNSMEMHSVNQHFYTPAEHPPSVPKCLHCPTKDRMLAVAIAMSTAQAFATKAIDLKLQQSKYMLNFRKFRGYLEAQSAHCFRAKGLYVSLHIPFDSRDISNYLLVVDSEMVASLQLQVGSNASGAFGLHGHFHSN